MNGSQSGQALVLLVLAIVGLLGFAGLALDGGMLYSERRRAQNTADNAALAAALKQAQGQAAAAIVGEGLAVAAQNDYANDGVNNWVEVTPFYSRDGNDNHVRVAITQAVRTQFIHLVYAGTAKLSVEAVAFADPPRPYMDGFAIASLHPGGADCTGNEFTARSGSPSIMRGGGAFVNARCLNGESSIVMEGSSARLGTSQFELCEDPDEGTCFVNGEFPIVVAGAVSGQNTATCPVPPDWWPPPNPPTACNFFPGPTENAEQVDQHPMLDSPVQAKVLDDKYCAGPPLSLGSENPRILSPGHYASLNVGANVDLYLNPGVYCLSGTGNVINAKTFTSREVNGVQGVMIYIQQRDAEFKWSGQGTFSLVAMDQDTCDELADPEACNYVGLALFKPTGLNTCQSNDDEIAFSGGSQMIVHGLIYAPESYAVFGGSGDLEMMGQSLVGCARYAGTGELDITYNPEDTYIRPPAIHLEK